MFSSKRILYQFDRVFNVYTSLSLSLSLSGWSAKELNFNKEFQEFETAFMFLVDSQCQGFHSIE